MSRLLRSIPATLIAIMVIFSIAQAQTSIAEVSITHLETAHLDNGQVQVSAFVSVLDEQGTPVLDLQADDFTLQENETLIEPQALTTALTTAPVTITLLIDNNSGMRNLDAAKNLAIAFMEKLGPEDGVAVYQYNTEIQPIQELTYDHNLAINQVVGQLNPSENPAACLHEALLTLVDTLANQGRQMILVLTGTPDGAAEACNGASIDDVIETATAIDSAIPIYVAGFGNRANDADLDRLSKRTGGESIGVDNATPLPDIATKVLAQIKSQYEISYMTQASGLATIEIGVAGSPQADDRQLLIPTPIPPTPTPVPQFTISLETEHTTEGRLMINVIMPDDVTLIQTELFVDNRSVQRIVAEPFGQFELDLQELEPGQHRIWVEATDTNQVTAMAEVEVDLTPLPTTTPAPAPTPVPTPLPAAEADQEGIPIVSLLLIVTGLVILLALVGLIGYLLFFYTKRSVPTYQTPPRPSPVNPLITVDDESPLPPRRPADHREVTAHRAKLVVVTGREALPQAEFLLQKAEIKIGRNTAKDNLNDISINDKEVSRSHAKIIYHDQNFFIQDLNSSSGTEVDRVKVRPTQELILQNGAEITIGPNVKLRFEAGAPRSVELTLDDFISQDGLRTQDDTEDPDQTYYSRTKK